MPTPYSIAFWNLENYFDEENSPRRSARLQNKIGGDLVGWTPQLRDTKRDQLGSIIVQLNGGAGPDILGVCEVENQFVVDQLAQRLNQLMPGRNYTVEHHDTTDQRGIDVAMIFDRNLFTPVAQFSHFVMRRTSTRDIFQVNFESQQNRLLVVIGNHWPSRSGGALKSAAYRAIAGETLAYFHERILEAHGNATPIVVMGDFNDEPFDPSLRDYALSWRSRTKVLNATKPKFHNLMWPLMGQAIGTYYFNNVPNNLDQFMVNKNMLRANSLYRFIDNSVQIHQFPEMVSGGDYPTPIQFGGMGRAVNLNGFSDHYPIEMTIEEAD